MPAIITKIPTGDVAGAYLTRRGEITAHVKVLALDQKSVTPACNQARTAIHSTPTADQAWVTLFQRATPSWEYRLQS
jgi:uncharacterized protein YhdP